MRQEGRTWDLVRVDAGGPPNYAIDVELKVPTEAKSGSAVIVIPNPDDAGPLEMPFAVLGDGAG